MHKPGKSQGETCQGRLETRAKDLNALAAAIRSGSSYPEDRRYGTLRSPADKINAASALLDPSWRGGSNEFRGIATLDEACGLLDARATASGSERDRDHAAAAQTIRDALWAEYRPRDVTGTVIQPGDEIEVTRPDGSVNPLASSEEARTLPPGAMRITSRPALDAHPADLYPNLVQGGLPEDGRRAAASECAARAVKYGRYLPFGKTAATAAPWEVEAAEADAARHAAILASQQAWERSAPQRRMAAARNQYDLDVGGNPDSHVPPVLVRNGSPGEDGTIPAIDQEGREYQVRHDRDTVIVTFEGRSGSAPAGTSPMRAARQLAGVLSGSYTPATGPHARLAGDLRGMADEIYALGSRQVDYSGAAPELLAAARLFDSGQVKEGRAALSRATRKLAGWQADDYFRNHIGERSRLTAGQAGRYADAIAALLRNAVTTRPDA